MAINASKLVLNNFHIVIYDTSPFAKSKLSIVHRTEEDKLLDPIYGISRKRVCGYSQIARTILGRASLSDIDKYLMRNYSSERDFFEINGIDPSFKHLEIAVADKEGYIHFTNPIFNNRALLQRLNKSGRGNMVDPVFNAYFCSMIENDKDFYDYIVSRRGTDPIGEDAIFDERVDYLRLFSQNDPSIVNGVLCGKIPAFYSLSTLRGMVYTDLARSYPVYRKQFLDTQTYNNRNKK